MKEKLRKILKHLLHTLKKEWLFIVIIVLIATDITYQVIAMKTYNKDKDVVLYKKLSGIVASSEYNSSVERMQISELLLHIDKNTKVYLLKEEKDKLSVLVQDGSKAYVVKHIPSISMTFTLESKLLEKQVAYEWVGEKEKPTTYTSKLLDAKYLNLLLLAGLVYFFMMTSGVNPSLPSKSKPAPHKVLLAI